MKLKELDKDVSSCPFCGAGGILYTMDNKLLIKMTHAKKCPCEFLHHATYTLITEDELKQWEKRSK